MLAASAEYRIEKTHNTSPFECIEDGKSAVRWMRVHANELNISPIHHMRSGIPPTIIFHGTGDTTVPYEQAERFTQAMHKAGNICELCAYEDKTHGFFNYGRDEGANYEQTVVQMDDFLVQQGFLSAK